MRVNPAYVQWIGDLIIPILGFLFWDWGFYFILLFILLDVITKEVFMHMKAYRMYKLNTATLSKWLRYSFLNTMLFVSFLILVHVAVMKMFPSIQFKNEWWNFWTYEDIGIQQGYVLLPLLAFSGYMQFKQTFILPNTAAKLTMESLWKPHIRLNTIRVFASAVWIALAKVVQVNEVIWMSGLLVSIALFQWFIQLRKTN